MIHQALDGMGFKGIDEVRQGKYFEINVKENDPTKAKELLRKCAKTFSKPSIEDYKIIGINN